MWSQAREERLLASLWMIFAETKLEDITLNLKETT